jgi:hypothetical protein
MAKEQGRSTKETKRDKLLQNALVAVSMADQALQEASGMKFPMKCFGCDGILDYKDNCYHQFKDCPNKGDNWVWENFNKNLQEFRERCHNKRKARGQWRQEGYPNRTTAD